MSDEKPGDTTPKPAEASASPPPAAEKAPAGKASPTVSDGGAPPSREEAMQRLRGDASELSATKFGKIIAEGNSRLDGAVTVNVFQGEFSVAGDFVSDGSGPRRPTARRPAKDRLDTVKLLEERDCFVRPTGYDQGVDMLVARNLLLLSGPARTGRRTRASATLLDTMKLAELEPQVFRLNGSVLGNMTWRVPQRECGFLVVDRAGKGGKFGAETITDAWLDYASGQLAEHQSFLVVVTGPVRDRLATVSKRADFVLEDLELPDPLEIVRRRVTAELLWDSADLDKRLAETEIEELLHERDDDPRFATRAAATVSEALRTGADLAEAVAKLSNPEEQVREWLERDPDQIEIAFVLATAVLEGASYLSVADAAVSLYRSLSGSSGAATPRYLRKLLAERSWIECVGRPGDTDGTPMLRFKHARLRPVVLALTWFEFDGARTKILEWLNGLAAHSNVEVRARAAQAAGILASNDFEHGVHRYFLPWALARSAPLRQSAAYALNVAGTAGRHTESAWSYVEQWTEFVGSGNARASLLATAGLTVGGQLGVESPRRALRTLRTLVHDGNWGLLEPVALSTQMLLEAGCGEEVLDALLEWTEDSPTEESVVKALTMFAFAVAPEDGVPERPLLLRTADLHRDALPELWGRALAAESVRPLALDALRAWVRVVDTDESARDVVLDVIAGIADRSETDFERLLHILHEWAFDAVDPSEAAADFHDELVEAGEEIP